MTIVESDEPISGFVNSSDALSTRSAVVAGPLNAGDADNMLRHHNRVINDQPNRRRHAAQGHDVEVLPQQVEKQTVTLSTSGTARAAIRVIFESRRKSNSTIAASETPISTASRTLVAEATIRSLWSYQLGIFTSGGSRFCSAASVSRMPCGRSAQYWHRAAERH